MIIKRQLPMDIGIQNSNFSLYREKAKSGNHSTSNNRESESLPPHTLPPEVRVEMARHHQARKDKKIDYLYESPCMQCDKRFLEYIVTSVVGIGVICFCAFKLNTADCDSSPPFWSLLSGTVGYFLKTALATKNKM